MTVQCISVLRDSSYGLCWMESNCVILSCQRQWRHQNKPKAASLGSLQATKSCNPPPPPPMNKEVPFPLHTYWHTNVKNESEARQNDRNPFSWHTALLLINVAIITQLRWWIIWWYISEHSYLRKIGGIWVRLSANIFGIKEFKVCTQPHRQATKYALILCIIGIYESDLTSGALCIPAGTGTTCFDALRRNSFALASKPSLLVRREFLIWIGGWRHRAKRC